MLYFYSRHPNQPKFLPFFLTNRNKYFGRHSVLTRAVLFFFLCLLCWQQAALANITIVDADTVTSDCADSSGAFTESPASCEIVASSILAYLDAGNDASITAAGNNIIINSTTNTLSAAVGGDGAATLTMVAERVIGGNIDTTLGKLNLVLVSNVAGTDQGAGVGTVNTNGGGLWLGGGDGINWDSWTPFDGGAAVQVGTYNAGGGGGSNQNAIDISGDINTSGGHIVFIAETNNPGVASDIVVLNQTISSGSGNITFIQSELDYDTAGAGLTLNTTGILTFEPLVNYFYNSAISGTPVPFTWSGAGSPNFTGTGSIAGLVINDIANLTGLVVGKSSSTSSSDITIASPISVAGSIDLYGGIVTINQPITSSDTGDIFIKAVTSADLSLLVAAAINKTGGNTSTLTLQGHARVSITSPITATNTALNVVLWSDYDNSNDDGGATLFNLGSVSTNGGHVWLGGSNSNGGSHIWNGLTVGDGPSIGSGGFNNNSIDIFTDITTNGGDIFAWAGEGVVKGMGNGSGSTKILNSGTGNITLVTDDIFGDNIALTTTGHIYLLPYLSAYDTPFDFVGAGANFDFSWSEYDSLVINNIATIGGLTVGQYTGTGLGGDTVYTFDNTSDITVSSVLDIDGPVMFYGDSITQNAAVTASGNVTYTVNKSDHIDGADAISLNAAIDAGNGDINMTSESGDIVVNGDLTTTSTSSPAIMINAGNGTVADTASGGDIVYLSGLLTTGVGGTIELYTGDYYDSTGVAALINGQFGGSFYNSDGSGLTFASNINVVYRENIAPTSQALDFDGVNDHVVLSDALATSISGGSAITIEYWFKGTLLNSAVRLQETNFDYIVAGWSAPPGFIISTDGGGVNGLTIASADVEDNQWHHVAMVWQRNTVNGFSVYLDGAVYATRDSADVNLPIFTTGASIGSYFGTQEFLAGTLDEVRIWNTARSSLQIRDNMARPVPIDSTGLVAYYNFDQDSGTALPDVSVSTNDGVLTNMDGGTDWVASTAYNTWLGNDSNWADTANWSLISLPSATDNVGIYSGAANDPDITGSPTVNHLIIGTTVSATLNSGFTVNGNFFLESDTGLNGQTITLGSSATLYEDVGIFSGTTGSITTTRTLNNISAENVAGLGATLTTSADMGSTSITRIHQTPPNVTGILRQFDITPTTNTGLNATAVFNYSDTELNTLTEADLVLYKSDDNGVSWAGQTATQDTANNIFTVSSLDGFSDWAIGVNAAPTITSSATTSVNENQTTAIDVNATDTDLDTLSYALSGTDSGLFNIVSATGVVSFATAPNFETPADNGGNNVYDFTVTVTDDGTGTLTDTQAIAITVSDVNEAPIISSSATASVNENQTAAIDVNASDPDSDTLSYALSGTDSALFGIVSSTGVVTFNTAPDFETPADNGGNNIYDFTVTVTDDGTGTLTDSQNIAITVVSVNEAPIISSSATASVNENQTAAIDVNATDPDSDTLSYALSGTDSALFGIVSGTGVVTFNTAPDFETPTDNGENNIYDFTVTVTDDGTGTLTDSQNIAITVVSVNEAPVITSNGGSATATINVAENTTAVTTVIATDEDSDNVSYTITGGADSATFSISNGVLTFLTAPDFDNPADVGVDNSYIVEITATDDGAGSLTDSQTITVNVTNTNEAPVNNVVPAITGTASVNNILSTSNGSWNDPDGDTLSYSYQWYRADDNSGTNESLIIGAINASYQLVSEDAHQFVRATVTADDGNGSNDQNATTTHTPILNTVPTLGGVFTSSGTVNDDSTIQPFSQVTVADVDNDNLSIAITYTAANGILSGTGITGTAGNYTITSTNIAAVISNLQSVIFTPTTNQVVVAGTVVSSFNLIPNDGLDDGIANATTQITVTSINDVPTISGTPSTSVAEDSAYNFIPTGTDVDVNQSVTLVYSIANQPSWASFNTATGALSGTPENADIGSTNGVVITVTDTSGGTATLASFNLEVTNTNDAPTISGTPITSIAEDSPYSFTPVGNDVDAGETASLVYSISNSPSWASFNTSDGTLSGIPTNDDVGTTNGIVITVTDINSASGSLASFNLTVTNINDAPTISGTPNLSVAEDSPYSFVPTGDDIDAGETATLVYSILNMPSWASFNTSDGALTGTPEDADVGITSGIAITVTDINGSASSLASFDLTVTNVDDAPVVSSAIQDINVVEDSADTLIDLSNVFSDIDNDNSAITKTVLSNSNSGLISTSLAGNLLTLSYQADMNGSAQITIRGTSNGVSVDDVFNVTVTSQNDEPIITSSAITSANEDSVYAYAISTNDADGDALTITASNIPNWLAINDNGDGTAVLTGTADNGEVGDHVVSLKVSDGSLSSYQDFTINVVNVNDAPEITSLSITVATELQAYSYTIMASDVDVGDNLTYSAITLPSWLTFDSNNQQLTGTPSNSDVGLHNIGLRATDGSGANDEQSFSIEVFNVNDTLIIDSTALVDAIENTIYSYTLQVHDIDVGDVLTSSVITKPDWLSFTPVTNAVSDGAIIDGGIVSGTPGSDDVGEHNIVIQVTDGTTPIHQTFTILVANVNDAPVISGTANTNVDEDALYYFKPTVSDPDAGDSKTFSISGQPSWATFDSNIGELTGTPANINVGTFSNIIITVTDASNASDSLPAFSITVGNTNDAPTISSTAVTNANEDNVYSYIFMASDVDVTDTLTFSAPTLPSWLSFDAGIQLLSGTPLQSDIGDHNVVMRVNDGAVSVDQSFVITVMESNDAPVISSTAPTTATEDLLYTYSAQVTDPDDINDGFELTWGLSNQPTGMTVSNVGVVTWTPENGVSTSGIVTLSLADGGENGAVPATEDFEITVTSTNDAPVADPQEINVVENIQQTMTLTATDIDGDSLTYNLLSSPSNGALTGTSPALTYLPDTDFFGDDSFTFSVNDGTVDSEVVLVTLHVLEDLDGDGIPDINDDDDDGDGISDEEEGTGDSDGDGIPDYRDTDSDGDGISDADEGTGDSDGDGTPDYLDTSLDEDQDGIPDIVEGTNDSDNDGIIDLLDTDSDNDGLSDSMESEVLGIDSDADGIDDAFDVDITGGVDANADGIDDGVIALDTDSDGIFDRLDQDSDNDGVPDVIEAFLRRSDTDGDGINDAVDVDITLGDDADSDGIDDRFDVSFTNGLDPDGDGIDDKLQPQSDRDNDGIIDYLDIDSDNDGIADSAEAGHSGVDSDSDGIDNFYDVDETLGVDINNDGIDDNDSVVDTDSDGVPDLHDLDSDNDSLFDTLEAGVADADKNALADNFAVLVTELIDNDSDGISDHRDLDSDDDGINDIENSPFASLDANGDGRIDITVDADGDGIDDSHDLLPEEHGTVTLDLNLDQDGDGIADITEGSGDTDNDGIINALDKDSDNDGLSDAFEADRPSPFGTDDDNDGIDDAYDVDMTGGVDTNGDGVDDIFVERDTDSDGLPDYLDLDSDNDGISDTEEQLLVALLGIDSDSDGIDDAVDVDVTGGSDFNNDGIDDALLNLDDVDSDGIANYRDLDSDGDGILDEVETTDDADNDGIPNYLDLDSDGDGISDKSEGETDADGDGIPNYLDLDSDGDGISDADENGDFNGDGINDSQQVDNQVVTGTSGSGSTGLLFITLLMGALLMRNKKQNLPLVALVASLFSFSAQASELCSIDKAFSMTECWYAGVGIGQSKLQPETDGTAWRLSDDSDTAVKLLAGLKLNQHWFAEISYENLGAAQLSNLNPNINQALDIDYSAFGVHVGYWLNQADSKWNVFARVGANSLNTDTSIFVDQNHNTQLSLSAGAQWHFNDQWFARFEITSYDEDARVLGFTIAKYFGKSSRTNLKPVIKKNSNSLPPAPPIVEDKFEEKIVQNPDLDNDGILNELDQCPDSSKGAEVNSKDCQVLESITLNIQFDSAQSAVKDEFMLEIEKVIQKIQQYGEVQVMVEGHTDWQGKQVNNQPLSEARAQVVADVLLQKTQLKSDGITVVGYGELKPVSDNSTEEGRYKNRRVVIILSQK